MPTPIKDDPLNELNTSIMVCRKCPLHHDCKQPVPGDGDRQARIVLIGDTPDYREDAEGKTLAGRGRSTFRGWLKETGLEPAAFFYTHVMKCRVRPRLFPEDNDVVDRCLPYLERQLKLLKPLAILIAGKRALEHVVLRNAIGNPHNYLGYVGKILRRRDRYGETRIGVIHHPNAVWNYEDDHPTKNIMDEKVSMEVMLAIGEYVRAIAAGDPPPFIEIEEVRPAGEVQHQRRLRLFEALGGESES